MKKQGNQWIMMLVLLLAFGVRSWQLQEMPPGWRDDELINSLVISQHVLDGEWAVYYADASGHEALYHVLNAGMLGLFGANAVGIRLLSVFLGVLTVALTYRVGKQLFNAPTGVLASAALAISFWSLMYSRIGLRHILTPPLMLGVVWFFWQGWFWVGEERWARDEGRGARSEEGNSQLTAYGLQLIAQSSKLLAHSPLKPFAISAIFTALGIYTYFASRGVPLILMAVVGYGAVFMWPRFRQRWLSVVVLFVITAVLSLPLLQILQQQPESEARVAELAVPIVEAQVGNYEPLRHHLVATLSMFHADGDDEWLYNIPHRPVFVGVTAVLFWLGVLISAWFAIQPLRLRLQKQKMTVIQEKQAFAGALLFAWWLAGISPGFISVPPASLGHTILAQPAVFILLALPVTVISKQLSVSSKQLSVVKKHATRNTQHATRFTFYALSFLTLLLIGFRDWPDYFIEWPERGLVRFLYRADIRDVADYVNNETLTDFGVTGLLAGPWDKLALAIDLEVDAQPRWYDPQRAILLSPATSFSGFPDVPAAFASSFTSLEDAPRAGYYSLTETAVSIDRTNEPICFENGLCAIFAEFNNETNHLTLGWEVERPLNLPSNPLISNPPPPGVYSGSRLAVFGQVFDENDTFLSGDDGLWVDPYTLQVGDQFLQQHWLFPPDGAQVKSLLYGLYDPMTGTRILTINGNDHIRLTLE